MAKTRAFILKICKESDFLVCISVVYSHIEKSLNIF